MFNPNLFDESVGLLKTGTIVGYKPNEGIILVKLNEATPPSTNSPVEVPFPSSLYYNNGTFIGSTPDIGTPIIIGQGSGNKYYYFVSFLAEDPDFIPTLNVGELLIQRNEDTKITLDDDNNIVIGSINKRIHANTDRNLLSHNFDEQFSFTQASRNINGLVKRDLRINKNFPQDLKLESDDYDKYYYVIGLDPSVSVNIVSGSKKNPPFVEKREQVYEFQYDADVSDNLTESQLYTNDDPNPTDFNFINRRSSRADTMSLTLAAPNYLMESVKGTVIDIFGNILDLNRVPIPVGKRQNTIKTDISEDKVESYLSIKELERKSIAYHFEINARKDLVGKNGAIALPDVESNADYGRNRSRFFIDVDKEGQFKINVPASSDTGNIPLLTRYENYSTLTDNPNQLIYREDNLDIFQDSFAAPDFARFQDSDTPNEIDTGSTNRGSIEVKDGDAQGTPIDRITEKHIKHGSPYHDILSTCYALSGTDYIRYQADPADSGFRNIDVDDIAESNEHLSKIISDVINISGDNANAGGRSGSINLDGSLEFYVGANTIDRQSMWLDFAGGVVGNIGRDLNNTSMALGMDGDVYMQIGGIGVATDSRFIQQNNGTYGAVLDLRVLTDGGYTHIIRIDNSGIKIMTPSFLQIHSSQGIKVSTDGTMDLQAEVMTLQERMVLKGSGGSI